MECPSTIGSHSTTQSPSLVYQREAPSSQVRSRSRTRPKKKASLTEALALKTRASEAPAVMCGRSVALGTRVAIALGIARLLLSVLVHRVRAGARASRWLFAGIRRGGRLFDYDAIASAICRNEGYNTKVFVGTTNAFGARWDLAGELLGTIAPRGLGVKCEHEDNEYDG